MNRPLFPDLFAIAPIIVHNHHGTAWMPTDPPRPAPEILNEHEAAVLLRIDDTPDSKRTLAHYRFTGALKAIKIGRGFKYRLKDLLEFAESQAREPVKLRNPSVSFGKKRK